MLFFNHQVCYKYAWRWKPLPTLKLWRSKASPKLGQFSWLSTADPRAFVQSNPSFSKVVSQLKVDAGIASSAAPIEPRPASWMSASTPGCSAFCATGEIIPPHNQPVRRRFCDNENELRQTRRPSLFQQFLIRISLMQHHLTSRIYHLMLPSSLSVV